MSASPRGRVPLDSVDQEQTRASDEREKTRLLHITTVPETFTFLGAQIDYMKSRGFTVHALTSPGEHLDLFAERLQIPVHTVEMPRRISPLRDVLALWRVYGIIRRIRPHIVHAHTPKGGLLGTAAAYLAGVPVRVYHIHGLPFMTASGFRRVLLRWSEKTSCRLASQVLCVSPSVRKVAVAEGICPPAKIKVPARGSIGGVDALDRFNPDRTTPDARNAVRARYGMPEDAVVIGFVGRIVRDKGVGELVEAWKWLREEYANLHLLVVGPFEPQDPVPPDAEECLRSDRRVHLVGLDWETPPLYAAMDLAVLPTYREGFGLVALEAGAMRLPVVATLVPGCVDAVRDGVTGTLVEPRDANALADALRMYLNYPALRRAHGEAGRERALRDFRPEDVWEATFQEYQRLLASRCAGHRDIAEESRL